MSFDLFANLPDDLNENIDRKLVEFRVNKLRLGVDIMFVKEIVNPQELTELPTGLDYVIGATDHREYMIPVIDLRRRLGVEPAGSGKEKWVIVGVHGKDIALLVDLVSGVTSMDRSLERARHPLMDGTDVSWVKRVYGGGAQLLFELQLDEVTGLQDAQRRQLATGEASE